MLLEKLEKAVSLPTQHNETIRDRLRRGGLPETDEVAKLYMLMSETLYYEQQVKILTWLSPIEWIYAIVAKMSHRKIA